MQELIEYLNKWDKEGEENFDALLCGTLVKAKLALEKEKEQIAKAVEDTRGNIVPRYFLKENLSGEEYYNQEYGQAGRTFTQDLIPKN